MRVHRYIMLALLATMLWGSDRAASQGAASRPATVAARASEPQLPITFCRGGRKVTGRMLPADLPVKEVALSAFGRIWTPPAEVRRSRANFLADFDVPAVRVPTVFSITSSDAAQLVLGRLVAYPDRDVRWDKKTLLLAAGTPKWFDQWARAVGLPVRWLDEAKRPVEMGTIKEDQRRLLLIGKAHASKSLQQLLETYSEGDCNLLVLGADWFADSAAPVAVRTEHMHAGLAEVGKQSWAKPLAFSRYRVPLGGIMNRWSWIDGPDGPLVEQVQRYEHGLLSKQHCPVVLSYLGWERVLGRYETADELLLSLLKASAKAESAILGNWFGRVWPEKVDAKDRPVLARIYDPEAYNMGVVYVLDVRGDGFPTEDQWKGGQAWEHATMLVLGDDKRLDESKWLKLDRAKRIAHRAGVVWLSDDELPPLRKNQIRVMLKLTQLGVPLPPPGQEEKKR